MPELITLTCEASEQAAALGLDDAQVVSMVRQAAMFTSKQANRRFDQFVFAVKANMITGVYALSPLPMI